MTTLVKEKPKAANSIQSVRDRIDSSRQTAIEKYKQYCVDISKGAAVNESQISTVLQLLGITIDQMEADVQRIIDRSNAQKELESIDRLRVQHEALAEDIGNQLDKLQSLKERHKRELEKQQEIVNGLTTEQNDVNSKITRIRKNSMNVLLNDGSPAIRNRVNQLRTDLERMNREYSNEENAFNFRKRKHKESQATKPKDAEKTEYTDTNDGRYLHSKLTAQKKALDAMQAEYDELAVKQTDVLSGMRWSYNEPAIEHKTERIQVKRIG